jgi:hypothetical protein
MAEEERKREIDKLAGQLMNEALEKLENSWTTKELEEAKSTFKAYVLEGACHDQSLRSCKNLSEDFGWNSVFTDIYFKEFKLKHFLNYTFDWFREKAKIALSSKPNSCEVI